MKKIITYLSLLMLLVSGDIYSQCLVNHDFEQFTGVLTTQPGGCPFITGSNTVNWRRSHGTPQIFLSVVRSKNYGYMWAESAKLLGGGLRHSGEGMFASYNFIKDQIYKVKIRVKTVAPANHTNSFFLYAANNVQEITSTGFCGSPPPTISTKQEITQNFYQGSGWAIFEYTFSPNANYSQIWIYPQTIDLDPNYNYSLQHNIYVDYISICPDPTCSETVTYNNGQLPSADTKHGFINVGSSFGGSGTVTVSPTANTILTSANEIIIKSEFRAIVTTGSFKARIESCTIPSSTIIDTLADEASSVDTTGFPIEDTSGMTQQQLARRSVQVEDPSVYSQFRVLSIYPNPTSNDLNIDVYAQNEGKIKIRVLNGNGVLVKELISNSAGQTAKRIRLDISRLPNGFYLIEVIDPGGNIKVRKIQKIG